MRTEQQLLHALRSCTLCMVVVDWMIERESAIQSARFFYAEGDSVILCMCKKGGFCSELSITNTVICGNIRHFTK